MAEETVDLAIPQVDPHTVAKPRVWHLFVLFGLAQVLILVASVIGIGVVAAIRADDVLPSDADQLPAARFEELATSPEVMLFSLVCGVVVCTGLALLVGAFSPQPFAERLRLRSGRLSAVELAVASIGFLALSNASDAILRLLPGYDDSGIAHFNQFFQGRGGAALWLTIALVGVAAPVGEELFYRGALQTRFAERFGRRAGLVVASVAFALAHFEPIHMLFALVAGLYVGWLCDLAGSCRASLAAHSVNNTAAAVAAAWMPSFEGASTTVPVAAASIVLATASTSWLWGRTRDRPIPSANGLARSA